LLAAVWVVLPESLLVELRAVRLLAEVIALQLAVAPVAALRVLLAEAVLARLPVEVQAAVLMEVQQPEDLKTYPSVSSSTLQN
jgi:hypothetical protein